MFVKPFRIPKQVVLPGLVVQVRKVPRKEIESDGCWVYDPKENEAVIMIASDLSHPVQRYTLLHELQHVCVDLLDQAIERSPKYFKTKHQARSERRRK